MKKQLYFNDLSEKPYCNNDSEIEQRLRILVSMMKGLPDVFEKKIRTENGICGIRVSPNKTLQKFLSEPAIKKTDISKYLRSIIRSPYIEDYTEAETRYCEANYYLVKNNIITKPEGLTSAFLNESIAIGFLSEDFWNQCKFDLLKEPNPNKEKNEVFCISKQDHFTDNDLKKWFEENSEVNLVESEILPENKKINLRDDHGKNILQEYSKKISRCPYIVEIINSLSFESQDKNFISNIKDNGIIYLRLQKTDKGLGIAVKTTGRNIRETKAIANIIKDKFYR